MTITAPNRNRQLNYLMRWFFVGIVVLCTMSIGLYNKTVALRRAVSVVSKTIDDLKLENAQLKNAYYAVLDTHTLISTAERLGYVKDSNPGYLTFRTDGTAAQDDSSVSLQTQHP